MTATASTASAAVSMIDGVDVDTVAAAVRGCAGVDGLYDGPGGIATYLPGRRIGGIRIDTHTLQLQVRAGWGVPAAEVASQIRDALAVTVSGRRIDVVIAELSDP